METRHREEAVTGLIWLGLAVDQLAPNLGKVKRTPATASRRAVGGGPS
jgi:hypothetical protein